MEDQRPNSNQRTLGKRVLFSLLRLVIFLLVVEVFFRLVSINFDSGRTRSGFVIPDEDLIWRLKPSREGSLATNVLGLRDTKFNPDADTQVLLLGDSVTWGDGVKNVKEVFPYRLERLLFEKRGERTYEVINSAVPGYSTFQQLKYLQLYGLKLEPDLIVLVFCMNDVVERYSSLAQYGGGNIFLGIDTRHAVTGHYGSLLRHSRAFDGLSRLVTRAARNRQEYDVTKMATDEWSSEMVNAWDQTLSEIDGIRQTAVQNEIPLLLVIAPYRFQLSEPEKTNQAQLRLLRYAKTHGVPVVDLLPLFASVHKKPGSASFFRDANHFSVAGHAHTADFLVEPILALLDGKGTFP